MLIYLAQRNVILICKFVYTFFGVIVIDFLFTLSEFVFGYSISWDGYIVVILLVVSMFYLAYYGIKQITLFIPEFLLNQDASELKSQIFDEDEKS